MKQKELMIQISTGGYLERKTWADQVIRAVRPLLEELPVKAVIMGWSADREIYRRALEFIKESGVRCYLWLPVFSETGVLKPAGRLIGYRGEAAQSYALTEGENFEFYCPVQGGNTQRFLEIYEEQFGDLPFDGVFLDKIRYGSFANGLEGVFSCFCPACADRYRAFGIDADELKQEMEKVRLGLAGYGDHPLCMIHYRQGAYEFENPIWGRFFDKKRADITQAVERLCGYFRARGMEVGLDVFSPFLAYFVGQDIERLGAMADFIKPMMYRVTQAPAGLAFEADSLAVQTAVKDPEGGKKRFYQAMGCPRPRDGRFSLEFAERELRNMTSLGGRVYAGIEVNRNHAAAATPEYIGENLQGMEHLSMDGYVLSWDILSAPEENLQAVKDYFAHRG